MNELKEIFEKYGAVVFFDTETTGLDAEKNQIIELAALRIEQGIDGALVKDSIDIFVKLPDGEKIPEKIVELTGITDETLESEGISEGTAAVLFADMIYNEKERPVLLVAHNAQFDLLFANSLMKRRFGAYGEALLARADYLDSLTVFKDRRPYPHKLSNAISAYKLQDKVQNTHRAIDDVEALYEVVKAMDKERADLLTYVNVFGFNPKYGVSGHLLEGVTYWPQQFHDYMQAPSYTLPAICRRRNDK